MNKRSRQRRQQQKAMDNIMLQGYSRKSAKAIYHEYKQYSQSSVFQNAAKKFGYGAYTKAVSEGPYVFKERGIYEIIKKYEDMRSKGLIGEDALTYNHEDFDSSTFATALVNDLFDDMENYITTATEEAEEHKNKIQSMLDKIEIKELPTFAGW
jgi:hypothetical protein